MKFLVMNGPTSICLAFASPISMESKITRRSASSCAILRPSWRRGRAFPESNTDEGALVDRIQEAFGKTDAIVINPAAYTHTSVALLDALKAVGIPYVEVHISDVTKREDFRQVSFVRQAALKTIMGQGIEGYRRAMLFLHDHLAK